ncbi:MAG: CMD domain protein [Roseiarcus sp.]|jgi:CMD domain protein
MSEFEPDVVHLLVGVARGSRLDGIRAQRPDARENAQKSYLALFAPKFPGDVSGETRYAVAAFVAGLHGDAATLAFYRDGLAGQDEHPGIVGAVDDEVARGAARGPYGRYPKGPLSVEDKTGPIYRVAEANRPILGARLSAALEHAHLLVFRPRDASPAALQSLLDVGWSTTDIVTLSQLVAFLSFQIRVIVGLRALAAAADGNA